MTELEARFWAALRRLEEWYTDSVKAQAHDSATGSTAPDAVVLKVQRYPFKSYWTNRWRLARDDEQRNDVIEELGKEHGRLSKGRRLEVNASQALAQTRYWLLDSGSYQGVEYRDAAQDLGIEPSTVWRWRKEKGLNERTGRARRN